MSIEDVRLRPANDESPPPRPVAFDSRYILPAHRVKLLEEQHPHPRDDRIVFYEEPHIYTIDGHPVQMSVSGLPHEFEGVFEPHRAIASMKQSRKEKWPRLAYVVGAQRTTLNELHTPSLLTDACSGLTLAVCAQEGLEGAAALELLEGLARPALAREGREFPEGIQFFNFERAMTDAEIVAAWEANAEDARNRGTEAHLQMELWFNSEPVRLEDGEVSVGLDFVRRCLLPIGAKAYRTEWTIFGEEENVAGCIDLAVTLPSGDLFLVDWKRSEKLQQKMYGYRKMKAPFGHLEDCSGCAYALQLSCYQYILEKYYGKRVVGRALASIHPEKPFTTATPYLKKEAEYLMARRRAITEARAALETEPRCAEYICSISGRFVMTAVRDAETGALYEEKVARIRATRVVDDPETTAVVQQLLEERVEKVVMSSDVAEWRTLFPAPTDNLLFF